MAFGADELRVLRRALAVALHPVPLADDDVQECLRLADSVDEAVREAGRLRAFLLADLARYRDALPGTATGYLERLQDALAAGYEPRQDDLAALRTMHGNPAAAAVLRRCQALAEESVKGRLPGRTVPVPVQAQAPPAIPRRARLLALPGGRAADESKPKPQPKPPVPDDRPVPKPSEVFPPRRKPVPPPEQWAVG